jgi:hypothetical protein
MMAAAAVDAVVVVVVLLRWLCVGLIATLLVG